MKFEDKVIDMLLKEIEFLYFLVLYFNKVFIREQFFDYIWGYNFVGDI